MNKLSFILIVAVIGCTTYLKDPLKIIDKYVDASGGEKYLTSTFEFDAGNQHVALRQNESISFSTDSASSVHQRINFLLFPFRNKKPYSCEKYLGDTMIENKIFYVIKINCPKEEIDEISQNEIRYWINRDDFTIGYIGYSIHVGAETELEFWKMINSRKIDGVRFYDYIRHKPTNATGEINDLELLFTKGELQEVERVELKNIKTH